MILMASSKHEIASSYFFNSARELPLLFHALKS
uniref:Uncharacterized protein n=1 Tax=Arcella intermedia TaxID=1963864 RepID=A0A6B2LWD0_9EUKA